MEKKFFIDYLLRPHWKALVVALIAIVFEGIAGLLDPWLIKIVLDYVIGSEHLPQWIAGFVYALFGESKLAILNFAVVAVVLVATVGAIATYTEKRLTTKVGQCVMRDLRRTLYHHIHRLSLSWYDRNKVGDLISRVTSDVDAIQDFVSSALLGVLVNLLKLVGIIVVMFYLDWRFTLIALLVAPLLFVEVYTLTRRIKKATREVRKKQGEIVSVVAEALSSIRIVKAFAREKYEESRLDQETGESMELVLRARSIKARLSPVVDVIVAAGTGIALWYGARLVLSGELTAGALVVFLLYLEKLYKPMRDLSKMTDVVSNALVGAERVKEVIATESQVRDLPGAQPAPAFKGEIECSHVSFGYDPEQLVLNDLSFKIKPGQFAAFVGPTGAGKSTIINLIPRFYDPLSGQVKIDGADVRSFTLKSLRQQISFVLQETLLFRAPVWQNIAYGKPEATREEIVRAAHLANAHEFIERMPEGYNTMVGERGVTLSGGQRQRLAIARAIIRNSPILILDEPSSGLDAASEELVFEALGRLMEGRTSIVIAHRLETIRKADAIFALQDGSIVESGTHEELLARGGLYAQLHDIQFRDAAHSSLNENQVAPQAGASCYQFQENVRLVGEFHSSTICPIDAGLRASDASLGYFSVAIGLALGSASSLKGPKTPDNARPERNRKIRLNGPEIASDPHKQGSFTHE
jgi:subfamily B ATP-binding cassette protein MsbA